MAKKKKIKGLTLRADGRYQVSATVGGKRKFFYSRDPDEALRLRDEFLDALRNPAPVTFAQVAADWQEAHWPEIGPGTRSTYQACLGRAIDEAGAAALADVGASEIQAVLLRMAAQGYSARTVKAQKVVFNLIFKHAIILGLTTFNPVPAVSVPAGLPKATREAPEDDVIQRIQEGLGLTFGLFAFFLLYTGCRKGEALAMQWTDIDFDRRMIRVSRSLAFDRGRPYVKAPKTRAGVREVPLLPDLADALLPLRQKSGYLFHRQNGEPLDSKTYERWWKHYCKDAGFCSYHPEPRLDKNGRAYTYQKCTLTLTAHQLRHGYATMLYEAGVDVQLAKTLLGHADISVTQGIYTHIRNKKQASAAGLLEAYLADQKRSRLRVVSE